jgi:hypothetical protein
MMPSQLRRGLANRRKNAESKPIAEQLPSIDIAELCRLRVFPSQYEWNVDHHLEMPFRYPFVRSLLISLQSITFNHHSDYNQIVPLRWIRTGFARTTGRRPLFVCRCARSVTKLYFTYGSLKCRRCADATYASRVLGKRTRPILQAKRLQAFLQLKAGTGMSKRNHQRLQARIATAPDQDLNSKRLAHHSIQRPQRNYGTRGAMPWR